MRCRKCGDKAAINMRHHKLALCKTHYLEWVPAQTQRFIEKYDMFGRDDRVLVAVSGGKDSLGLWDVLVRLGYRADGLYIGLGIDGGTGYSSESERRSRAFAEEKGLHLIVADVEKEEGSTIPLAAANTARGRGKPCSVCGLTKRHIMNRAAREGGYDVLATGHNLDDEAAVLFGNTLSWSVGYLARQGPVLPANTDGLVRKVKPFCRLYERETAAYALLRGIEYIYEECPHATGATSIYYKELLNKLEADRPGAKLSFYLSFLEAKRAGLFAAEREAGTGSLHTCTNCGQPTTAPGLCAFCRTWDQVRSRLAVTV
ncbi:MAG TPA: arginosuccinate synthase [Anaerolineales bacterium]|nr:arginosuccinate synthase [Anaerolineales bacterium]